MASGRRDAAADRLSLTAAPVLLVMALLSAITENEAAGVHSSMPVGGMALMYALMGFFHSAPWIRLRRAQGAKQG